MSPNRAVWSKLCNYAKDLFKILEECKTEPLKLPYSSADKEVTQFSKTQRIKSKRKSTKYDYDYKLYNGHLTKSVKFREKGPQIKTDGVNSFSTRKIHYRYGTRSQRYFKSAQPLSNFYNVNKEVFNEYDVDLDKNVIVGGCFDTNKHTLQNTSIPLVTDESLKRLPTFEDFVANKKPILATIRKMKIDVLGCPTFDDCLMSHFNKDSQPGFSQYVINKLRTKSKAYKTSCNAGSRIFKKLDNISKSKRSQLLQKFLTDKPTSKGLYTIGARNKRDYTYEDFEIAGSRPVHMPEFHNEISTSGWIDLINDSIKIKGSGPIYIGNSITTYERYERDLAKNNDFLEGDWRKFDSTYSILGIIVCVVISRLYYPLYSKRADVHFYWIFYLHLIKDYYLPGGYVVRILRGLPSGTKCTSIWNSIYNLFTLLYCCKELDYKSLNFAVGGDDFVIMTTKSFDESIIDNIVARSVSVGMEFKFLDKKFKDSDKASDYPYFYKYSVKDGLPILSPTTLMERLFCPFNKPLKNTVQVYDYLNSQIPALGYPSSTHLLFYSLYKNVYNSVYKNFFYFKPMTIKDVYLLHKQSYNSFRYCYKRRTSIDKSFLTFNGTFIRPQVINKLDRTFVKNLLVDEKVIEVKDYYFK